MKKKIFLLIAILLAIGILAVILINIILIPAKVRVFITKTLEQKLGRKIEVEIVRYIPPTTLSLNNVIVYRSVRATRPLIKAENMRLNLSLLPYLTQKKLISTIDLNNLSIRDLSLNGSIRTSLTADSAASPGFEGVIRLVNITLNTDILPAPIERFNGVIDIKKDGIKINNAYFYFKGTSYELKGNLKDLEKPEVNLSLNSNGFLSEGKFLFKNGFIQIEKLNTRLANSSLDLIGDVSNFDQPLLNLYGDSRIDIRDLEDSKYSGICDAALFFKGQLNRPEDFEFGLKVKSDRLVLRDIIMNNFYLDLRMKDGLISTERLSAGFYDGSLTGSINADVKSPAMPYSMEFSIRDTNLARWAKEAKFGKRISGLVSSRILLKCYAGDTDSLSGRGWLSVSNGYIWEVPVLGGVANILSLPNLKSIIFREAAGNFSIENRKINISDLVFYSDNATLSVKGSIDFDSNLDLIVTTNITSELIEGSSEAAKIANILIQQAGQFLGRVEVTGTIKDPVYKIKPGGGIKPIEKIFKKEIGDLLKDILE